MVSHALINKTHAEPIIPIENSSKDHALRAFAFFLKKILTKSKYTMDFKIGVSPLPWVVFEIKLISSAVFIEVNI